MNQSIDNTIYIAAQIYCHVKQFFVFESELQIEAFEKQFFEYSSRISRPLNRMEFYLETSALLASLENSHTIFMDRSLFSEGRPLPFSFRPLSDKWVVVSSSISDIGEGDFLTHVGDLSIDEFYQSVKGYISASSDRSRRYCLSNHEPVFNDVRLCTFEDGAGERRVVDLSCCEARSKISSPDTFSYVEVSEGVWHLRIKSFQDFDIARRIVDAISDNKMRSIIMDVRGNSGGMEPTALMEFLIDEPYFGYADKTPLHMGVNKAYRGVMDMMNHGRLPKPAGNEMQLLDALASYGGVTHLYQAAKRVFPSTTTFDGKLVLLTDGLTASAAEDFVLPFTQIEKVPIIGEPTLGSTGQIAIAQLSPDRMLYVGTRKSYFPDGTPFEGVGISPNIEVVPSAEDLRDGRDPVLKRAVEELARR